jgi:5-methylcytosine-specific restriction endonuclease McrA
MIKHGTVYGYFHQNCRCDFCKKAGSDYRKDYKERKKNGGVISERGVAKHGTQYMYDHYKCRCDLCREAVRIKGRLKAERAKSNDFRNNTHGISATYSVGCRCSACKEAHKISGKIYDEKNSEEVSRRRREYRDDHKLEIEEKRKLFYLENRERILKSNEDWRRNNPEKALAIGKKWRDNNPEKAHAACKKWSENNHEKVLAYSRNYDSRKRSNEGSHTDRDIRDIFDFQNGLCRYCDRQLYYIRRGYVVDHVMPVSLGGSNGPENLVISCQSCNSKKHAMHPDDWFSLLKSKSRSEVSDGSTVK